MTASTWDNKFFGFHRQFIFAYDNYLASIGESYVQTWVAAPGAIIPPPHGGRPANTPCGSCVALPSQFLTMANGGTLEMEQSITQLGDDIVNWHNINHVMIAKAGGTGSCGVPVPADMACPAYAASDPIFYQYHNLFNDIQNEWMTFQPSDIALVLDRSGSMSLPTSTGGTRLDAAKAAASLFVDLLENNAGHKVGMISFSTSASSTPDMPLTDIPNAPAAISAALSGLVASGSTSIGDGLAKVQALITGGAEARKAILLLTDGMENTPPMIADVEGSLGDIHGCSIGLGTPGTLDGPKLEFLSERQGGIYISTPDPLLLKKYFVFCFGNLFDTFVGEDPVGFLPSGTLISPPTVHQSASDSKLVFVLSWTNTTVAGDLRLGITTPSGNVLQLDGPEVQSKFGETWHIVRVALPYNGEQDGNWTARAVRPVHNFVNGFTSRSSSGFSQGTALVQAEIAGLCPSGCRKILYYEDAGDTSNRTFQDVGSIYAAALTRQTNQRLLGNVTGAANATEFERLLQTRFGDVADAFDLLVYSSQYTEDEQPYDVALADVLCRRLAPAIISDNRATRSAATILGCAGARRGAGGNFTTISPTDSQLLPSPAALRNPPGVIAPSYSLLPVNGSEATIQASFDENASAILVVVSVGPDEDFFITVLAKSVAAVEPSTYRNNTYTLESLHPTFRIPAPHWPQCGYDKVVATVNVTRPLKSLSCVLASAPPATTSDIQGDSLSSQAAAALALGRGGLSIPTETLEFGLYDDGTHGDSSANDQYFEVSLPTDVATYDGKYDFHAFFTLCRYTCGRGNYSVASPSYWGGPYGSSNSSDGYGDGGHSAGDGGNASCSGGSSGMTCIYREAQESLTVLAQMCAGSNYTVEPLPANGYGGRSQAKVRITPADENGTLLGTGWADTLVVGGVGDVVVESVADDDGKGTYAISVDYTGSSKASSWKNGTATGPAVVVQQFGRPKNAVTIPLP